MAVYDTVRVNQNAAQPSRSFFYRAASAVLQWNETRKTRAALSRLSDRELSDIGITRADIDQI